MTPRPPAYHSLWLFPLVAGTAWFATLTTLLARWLALGRPRYPGQANPALPFVSDIGAFTLQPVFIAGCAVTGVAFAGTVAAVHASASASASARLHGGLSSGWRWRWRTRLVARFAGLAAAAGLVLLSVFDTFESHVEHRYLLMGTFGALGVSAVLTSAVWWDQTCGRRTAGYHPGLRKWCLLNTFLVVAQTCIGVAFVTTMYAGRYRASGFLEWTLTYIGSFWLLSFVGFTRVRDDRQVGAAGQDGGERQPLLA